MSQGIIRDAQTTVESNVTIKCISARECFVPNAPFANYILFSIIGTNLKGEYFVCDKFLLFYVEHKVRSPALYENNWKKLAAELRS